MSKEKACKTPLIELLRSVPKDHRTEWEIQWSENGLATGHAMCPIGKHCHEAADRLEAAEQTIREMSGIIRAGDCPNDCVDGALCLGDYGVEQCQWCCEKEALLEKADET